MGDVFTLEKLEKSIAKMNKPAKPSQFFVYRSEMIQHNIQDKHVPECFTIIEDVKKGGSDGR